MTRSTMIHYVTDVTDWDYNPSNGNNVSFSINDSAGGYDRMVLFFENNSQQAKGFYERNTSPTTGSLKDKKRIQDLEKALELIAYGNIRVTDIGSIAKDALEADPEYIYLPF